MILLCVVDNYNLLTQSMVVQYFDKLSSYSINWNKTHHFLIGSKVFMDIDKPLWMNSFKQKLLFLEIFLCCWKLIFPAVYVRLKKI